MDQNVESNIRQICLVLPLSVFLSFSFNIFKFDPKCVFNIKQEKICKIN